MSSLDNRLNLIGLDITVLDSSNRANLQLQGKVVDETRCTLLIVDKHGNKKRLIKKQNTFEVKVCGDKKIIICGECLSGRPEERIKG